MNKFLVLLVLACPVSVLAFQPAASLRPATPGTCNVRDFGATGDGHTLDTAAINKAVQSCASSGGGTVEVPSGRFLTGTIHLRDHITLHLDAGSVLLGSPDMKDYDRLTAGSEGRDTALIVSEDAHDVAITGEGTIDGNGASFIDKGKLHWHPFFDPARTRGGNALREQMQKTSEGPVQMKERPGLLLLMLRTDGISLHDFHVRDAPNWSVKVVCSDHIEVRGLDIRNSLLIPNSDALDVSNSSNVIIADSYFEAGDDALVVGGPCGDGWCRERPAENITVSNVILRSRSAAIRVGPNAAGARNMSFNNIVIYDSNRGIMVQARDAETIENLLFNNITIETRLTDGPWWGSGEPITLTVAKWAYASWNPPSPEKIPTPGIGLIRHVRFSHIVASSTSPVVLYSTEPGRIQDLRFDDLSLTMKASPLQPILGGNLDLQPTTPKEDGLVRHDLPAIFASNVRDLALDHVRVTWADKLPEFYTNAIGVDHFDGLKIQDFSGEGNVKGAAAIRLGSGTRAVVKDATATHGRLMDIQQGHSRQKGR